MYLRNLDPLVLNTIGLGLRAIMTNRQDPVRYKIPSLKLRVLQLCLVLLLEYSASSCSNTALAFPGTAQIDNGTLSIHRDEASGVR